MKCIEAVERLSLALVKSRVFRCPLLALSGPPAPETRTSAFRRKADIPDPLAERLLMTLSRHSKAVRISTLGASV